MLIQIAACFLATVFFSFLMNQPIRTVWPSAVIAAVGYLIFLLLNKTTIAYFFAALFISVSCECLARRMRSPSTLFTTSAIIPLVPGIGLYRTMLYLTQENFSLAGETGSETALGICAIALAITLSSICFNRTKPSIPRKYESLP